MDTELTEEVFASLHLECGGVIEAAVLFQMSPQSQPTTLDAVTLSGIN
jgi:hypothetical protein